MTNRRSRGPAFESKNEYNENILAIRYFELVFADTDREC